MFSAAKIGLAGGPFLVDVCPVSDAPADICSNNGLVGVRNPGRRVPCHHGGHSLGRNQTLTAESVNATIPAP